MSNDAYPKCIIDFMKSRSKSMNYLFHNKIRKKCETVNSAKLLRRLLEHVTTAITLNVFRPSPGVICNLQNRLGSLLNEIFKTIQIY